MYKFWRYDNCLSRQVGRYANLKFKVCRCPLPPGPCTQYKNYCCLVVTTHTRVERKDFLTHTYHTYPYLQHTYPYVPYTHPYLCATYQPIPTHIYNIPTHSYHIHIHAYVPHTNLYLPISTTYLPIRTITYPCVCATYQPIPTHIYIIPTHTSTYLCATFNIHQLVPSTVSLPNVL